MVTIRICQRCRGEGRKTVPPYNPRQHEAPLISREDKPCSQCHGVGYMGLDYNVLKNHVYEGDEG